ncbi:hypothetical protein TCA2_4572 [Paenibacillus sp. TCA20]|uniref:VWA domain-containing protein n=1 Tax=Paenibacillus sp. TCA20 TaxID=1499968 RepID=UPI0004DA8F62|nr:VWA domain-containing protein [Paenibacillus sp. TCA20]GAK42080.1 hypothetical protein TCA2_4572 [Paenibacillus sp. TCA20]
MTQKNKTPLLKGFTIKAYTGAEASDSEASLRRASTSESGSGSDVVDPPYYPPEPTDPSAPDNPGGGGTNPTNPTDPENPGGGGGSGDEDNPGGGSNPDNPGGGGGTDDPEDDLPDDPSDGVSSNGRIYIRILERKDNPDKYCLGIDYPVKVRAWTASEEEKIIKIVLKFKMRHKGGKLTEFVYKEYTYPGSVEESIELVIPKATLDEWGVKERTYLQLIAVVYTDQGRDTHTTDYVRFENCGEEEDDPDKDTDGDGIPDKDDPNPEQPDELQVTITPKTTEICYGDDLIVSGVADGPYPITKVVMLVNGTPLEDIVTEEPTEPETPTEPNTPNSISYFVDGSISPSSINQDYWTGNKAFSGNVQITAGNIVPLNIQPNFFTGRNQWLDFMEKVRRALAPEEDTIYTKSNISIQNFHAYLWKFHQDNLRGLVTLPQPWSTFKSWAVSNLPGLTELQLGSIYATYKIKAISFFFPSASSYLSGDIIDTLSDLVAKTNTYTYHWIDFNDIQGNPSVAAWAKDGELPQFYSFINFEPDALNASVINLMAYRPTDYTSNSSRDESDTLTPLDKYKSYWLPVGSLGTADLQTLNNNQPACRPYIAGEIAIHEIGHAVGFYGADYYKFDAGHKYASDIGKSLHDYREWQEISGWDSINWSGMRQYYKLNKSNPGTKLDNGKEAPVTAYGCTQPAEGFAEAYRLYIINPSFLRDNFPKQYAFMEKYVKNMESIDVMSTASFRRMSETVVIDGYHSPFWMAASPYEQTFNFRYPTLGHEVGDSFVVEVKAYDSEGNEASDSMTVTVKDCSIDPEGPKVRDCLMFDTLHVEYYDANLQDIKKFDIPADWLPYEINNGDGATAMFGWGEDDTITAWFKDGGNSSGYGFQLSSIGVNYLDEHNNAKTAWASNIYYETAGVKNSRKMLGDPTGKDTSWMNQILTSGSYTESPSIGSKGDYVKFKFPSAWSSNQCPINKDIIRPEDDDSPEEDPTNPNVPDYDPEKNPVRDCLMLDKIIFQYYSDVTKEMQTNIVPLEWLVTQELTIETKAGPVTLVAGWSDYYKGVSLMIRNATGANNIFLTGVGIIFKDFYDDSKTAWASDINFKTAGAKNTGWMTGGPKNLDELPWVAEVDAGNYGNAPVIGKTGDFIVSKHMDLFTSQVCSIDPEHNSDPETGVGADPILEVTVPSLNPEEITHCNTDPLTIGGYAEIAPKVTEIKATFNGEEFYQRNGNAFHEDFNFTIPSRAFGEGGSGGSSEGGIADIIFLIDYSGSMGEHIASVADNVNNFIRRLNDDNVDYRLGCVRYSDINYSEPTTKTSLTTSASEFESMLRAIVLAGGGDTRESVLESIMDPVNGALTYDFRENAAKHFVLVTDAHFHDKEVDGMSIYTAAQAISAMREKGVIINIIGPMGEGMFTLKQLSDGTGGQYLDIKGDYGNQLTSISGQISEDAGELISGYVVITATGTDGKTVTRRIKINVVDCSVPPPGSTPDEGNIENSYDLLFRLRWGIPTNTASDARSDMDLHGYLDRDEAKHIFYGSRVDAEYPGYRSYIEGTNKIYLNFDYADHMRNSGIDHWNNEVEIITVDGFVNRTLTLVVDKYYGVDVSDLDRAPQVEIVDAGTGSILQTIVLSPTDFNSKRSIIVCDIALKNPGQTKISDITIRKEPRDYPTPN